MRIQLNERELEVEAGKTLMGLRRELRPDADVVIWNGAPVSEDQPLSEGEWIGRGRPFSKAEFVNLRQYLITSGLACWRDQRYPTQGIELTAYGRNVMRQLATPEYARTRTQ